MSAEAVIPPGSRRIEPIEERRARLQGGFRDLIGGAVEEIDAELGRGYAERHPALIGHVLVAGAIHTLSDGLDERTLDVGEAIAGVGVAVSNLAAGFAD